jgi:secreted trypsin-like serine protease
MRLRLLTVATLVAGTIVATATATATAARPAAAIVGGWVAGPAPWAVQVYDDRPGTGLAFQCTGTLIAARWALTARHCLPDAAGESTVVRVGSNTYQQGTAIAVDQNRYPSAGDIALLHLTADATAVPRTGTIRLADRDPAWNTTGWIYGFGRENADGPLAPALKMAGTNIILPATDDFGGPTLATWGISGAGWRGDSGGPLVVNGVQVGVIVKPLDQDGSNPHGWTDCVSIAHHRGWIRGVAGV